MALSLRRTRFQSPAYADRQDYLVMEDGQVIGRIYEERYVPANVDGSGRLRNTFIQRLASGRMAEWAAFR
jgi:hypothetical protein